ncbi:MAG: hypothetical protein K2U26_10560, partial [Cyclobacteriaceae bacterium]|nr:hypothetical protein [Cyclobacteriaceae bacterium]
MGESRFTESWIFKMTCVALLVTLVTFSLIYFKDLLKPIALGILLWYLIKAFNSQIEKIKIKGRPLNPWIRRAIALLVIIGLVQGSIEIFVANVNQIIANYATYQATLNTVIAQLGDSLGIENMTDSVKERISAINIEGFLKGAITSTSSLLGNTFLVIFYTIFLLLEENSFVKKMSLVLRSPE